MRHLLNTLFVLTEDAYLSLDGENVVVNQKDAILSRFPLHTLQSILSFSYAGASPALMGACVKHGVTLSFCTPNGRFLGRVMGESHGNVLLRRTQYRVADDAVQSCDIAKCFLFGKLFNARQVIERARRDHGMRIDDARLHVVSDQLKDALDQVLRIRDVDTLRGLEGAASSSYFRVFDELILGDKTQFRFDGRNRRPPLDKVNALLSFAYSLLANDCASALESVGLDSYVGFLHCDRSGRKSLATDLMEEFRPCVADRFVLTLINNRVLSPSDFICQESGAVSLTDAARKTFLKAWQDRKREVVEHPFLHEKVPRGLLPYVQALLLSRYLRDELDAYPSYLWK